MALRISCGPLYHENNFSIYGFFICCFLYEIENVNGSVLKQNRSKSVKIEYEVHKRHLPKKRLIFIDFSVGFCIFLTDTFC